MKKTAASLGFVDVAGLKLGMTPAQALAAVQAFNPKMRTKVIQARMESPDAPGTFTRIPRYIVAHSVGIPRYASYPAPFFLADGSADEIVLEFTIPPSPPLLGKITRMVTFPTGQPIVASNLVESLHKKYGDETETTGNGRHWVLDAGGKLVTRQLTAAERSCLPSSAYDGFGWAGGGQMPNNGDDLTNDAPGPVSLTTTSMVESEGMRVPPERAPVCSPFTIVEADNLGEGAPPNQQLNNLTVTLQSPALLYASRRATHDWLKAKGEAKQRQLEDAAKARTGPKL